MELLSKEIWKDVIGYDGMYKISNFGNVKSFKKDEKGILLNPYIGTTGYYFINLSKKSKIKLSKIHRLVAFYFIPNHLNLPCVNHIDGNKLNNNDWNLEWCTYSENNKHAHRLGLNFLSPLNIQKKKEAHVKLVLQIDYGIFYESIKEAAYTVNFGQTYLSQMLSNKYKNKTNLIKV